MNEESAYLTDGCCVIVIELLQANIIALLVACFLPSAESTDADIEKSWQTLDVGWGRGGGER